MFFRTYNPSAQLAPYIRSYWILEHNEMPAAAEAIIPDGCMEMIFHYGDEYVSSIAQQEQTQNGIIIVGQIKEAISIQATGHTGIFSIRFQPWGFYAFTGMGADKLTEQVVAAEDIFGKSICIIQEHMQSASHEEKVNVIEGFLVDVLHRQKARVTDKVASVAHVLSCLHHHTGNLPVAHMAYRSNVSIRQFNRNVLEITGLQPKLLSRIIRLQAFLNIHEEGARLTDSLYKCGYFDQAHFIREFKDIANMTPNKFFKEEHLMAELMLW